MEAQDDEGEDDEKPEWLHAIYEKSASLRKEVTQNARAIQGGDGDQVEGSEEDVREDHEAEKEAVVAKFPTFGVVEKGGRYFVEDEE
jgi:hypothetical protein